MRSTQRFVSLALVLAAGAASLGSCANQWQTGAVVGGIAGGILGDQMDRHAAEPKQNIRGATVERVGEGIQITFDSGLLYAFDSDVLRSEARTNLDELARSFGKYGCEDDEAADLCPGHPTACPSRDASSGVLGTRGMQAPA